jgi:hypothetical protein
MAGSPSEVSLMSPDKTFADGSDDVGMHRPLDADYQSQFGDPSKTGRGRSFLHKVKGTGIEVTITDDVGTRGFHLSEIDPTTVCMSGFHVKPNLKRMAEVLQEAGELYRLKCVPTKSGNAFRNHYIFAHFESKTYKEETPQVCEALVAQLKQKGEKILFITRDSSVDQVFFGTLVSNIKFTEQNLIDSIDFGNLIHLEIKRYGDRVKNYGFATLLDSQERIKKLVRKRFYTVKGCKIELKPKLNSGQKLQKQKRKTRREEKGGFPKRRKEFRSPMGRDFRSPLEREFESLQERGFSPLEREFRSPSAPMYNNAFRENLMRSMRHQQMEAALFKKHLLHHWVRAQLCFEESGFHLLVAHASH